MYLIYANSPVCIQNLEVSWIQTESPALPPSWLSLLYHGECVKPLSHLGHQFAQKIHINVHKMHFSGKFWPMFGILRGKFWIFHTPLRFDWQVSTLSNFFLGSRKGTIDDLMDIYFFLSWQCWYLCRPTTACLQMLETSRKPLESLKGCPPVRKKSYEMIMRHQNTSMAF